MYDTIGMEAIDFQLKSNLGDELTTIFNDVFDYKDSLEDSAKLVAKVTDYLEKTFSRSITACIERNTGIKVRKVELIPYDYSCGMFAVDLRGKHYEDSMRDIMSAESGYRRNKMKGKSIGFKDFLEMAEQADLSNSKVHSSQFKGRPYEVKLILDVAYAFFGERISPYTKPLTASELAAIYMHEIGHTFMMFEYAVNQIQVGQLTKQLRENLKGNASSELAKNAKDIKLIIHDSDHLPKGSRKVMEQAVDAVERIEGADLSRFPLPIVWTINAALDTIATIMIFIAVHIVYSAPLALIAPIFKHLKGFGGKKTEETHTGRVAYNIERYADEFVVRHGYGDQLSSGLDKIFKLMKTANTTMIKYQVSSQWELKVLNTVLAAREFMLDVLAINTFTDTVYESEVNRQKRILENNRAIFKNADLPKDIRDRYLKNCVAIEKRIKQMEKREAKIRPLNTVVNILPKAVTMVDDLVINGTVPKDMEKVLNEIDAMSNSKLYEQAARLQSLKG